MSDRTTQSRGLLPVLLLLAAVLVLAGPLVLDRFTMNVLTRSMIYAILALTVDLLWGFTGILTFGQSAFFDAGAYATAMVLTHLGGAPEHFVLAFVLAIAIPTLLAALVGWLSFHQGATPLYATVISLVVPIVMTQLIFAGGQSTGSSSGLVGYPTLALGAANHFRLAGMVLIGFGCLAWVFVRSDAGRMLVAIRDNEMRAAYLGLRVQLVRILLMTVLGGVAGLAGFLLANAARMVAPEIAGFVFGTQLVIWTALGGRGTLLGPVAGTLGIDWLGAKLSGELPFLWQLLIGAIFVVMILFLPRGLAGLVPRRRHQGRPPELVAIPTRRRADAPGPVLSVRGLGKSYGSLHVLESIDLEVHRGELVSLVGPNGAGKTTMMRCLSDGTEPISGSITVLGRDIGGLPPERIVRLGVGRKFQLASVFESLSVADCLRLARMSLDRPSLVRRSRRIGLPAPAIDILRLTGLDGMLNQRAGLLSHGQKQALELAMVVALEPELILLDEPTAGLTKAERAMIGGVLQRLSGELGHAVILIEHDLDFVRIVSQRIVVLHQGRMVMDGTVGEVVDSDLVRAIYSGAANA
ncbi:ATP-binding cassette domain-containing protein [Tabrizicola sp.]|uniref:branched-chain amino acid ABC transporter ATP-binding protein/permease n=1 Tax=Tabrizicola sp. TaxID=2005166 RepID=UPI0035AF4E17